MNGKADLSLWIRLSQTENIGPKGFNKILSFLKHEHKSLSDVFTMNIKELSGLLEKCKIRKSDPYKIIESKNKNFDKLLSTLEEKRIKVLTLDDENYPKRIKKFLGENAPPVLYAFGNLALLDKKSLAIVGSRHASEGSINIAQSIAGLMAKRDVCVVSGYAAGIDSSAHWGALNSNGTTIIVLPYGILYFKWKEPFYSFDELSESALILSEFYPSAKWNTGSAMQRNKTLVALSAGVFAVEFTEDGGTFDTIKSTAKLKKPLFVIDSIENRKVLEKNKMASVFIDTNSQGYDKNIFSNIEHEPVLTDNQISLF